jgi:hypothetical protein
MRVEGGTEGRFDLTWMPWCGFDSLAAPDVYATLLLDKRAERASKGVTLPCLPGPACLSSFLSFHPLRYAILRHRPAS